MIATTLPAPDTARLAAASGLQKLLPELVALSLDAKQAHWNMTGPAFLPLHALTDRIAEDTRAWADRIAERAVALGFYVDARPATVAAAAGTLPPRTGHRHRSDRRARRAHRRRHRHRTPRARPARPGRRSRSRRDRRHPRRIGEVPVDAHRPDELTPQRQRRQPSNGSRTGPGAPAQRHHQQRPARPADRRARTEPATRRPGTGTAVQQAAASTHAKRRGGVLVARCQLRCSSPSRWQPRHASPDWRRRRLPRLIRRL